MPSRAYTSFLRDKCLDAWVVRYRVNALSGLYLTSTKMYIGDFAEAVYVSMPSRAYTSLLLYVSIARRMQNTSRVNALSGLYLTSTVPLQKPRFYAVFRACFCRYLSEYSDNSRFSCMLTIWTYSMRYTYPWHLIKYNTKHNRCHLIFSLSW